MDTLTYVSAASPPRVNPSSTGPGSSSAVEESGEELGEESGEVFLELSVVELVAAAGVVDTVSTNACPEETTPLYTVSNHDPSPEDARWCR